MSRHIAANMTSAPKRAAKLMATVPKHTFSNVYITCPEHPPEHNRSAAVRRYRSSLQRRANLIEI
jgi:hypothetical protein